MNRKRRSNVESRFKSKEFVEDDSDSEIELNLPAVEESPAAKAAKQQPKSNSCREPRKLRRSTRNRTCEPERKDSDSDVALSPPAAEQQPKSNSCREPRKLRRSTRNKTYEPEKEDSDSEIELNPPAVKEAEQQSESSCCREPKKLRRSTRDRTYKPDEEDEDEEHSESSTCKKPRKQKRRSNVESRFKSKEFVEEDSDSEVKLNPQTVEAIEGIPHLNTKELGKEHSDSELELVEENSRPTAELNVSVEVDAESESEECNGVHAVNDTCEVSATFCVPVHNEAIAIDHAAVSKDHESIPVNNEAVAVDAEAVATDHETVPVDNETVSANHEAVPVNNEAVATDHEAVATDVATDHETVPVDNESADHETAEEADEAVVKRRLKRKRRDSLVEELQTNIEKSSETSDSQDDSICSLFSSPQSKKVKVIKKINFDETLLSDSNTMEIEAESVSEEREGIVGDCEVSTTVSEATEHEAAAQLVAEANVVVAQRPKKRKRNDSLAEYVQANLEKYTYASDSQDDLSVRPYDVFRSHWARKLKLIKKIDLDEKLLPESKPQRKLNAFLQLGLVQKYNHLEIRDSIFGRGVFATENLKADRYIVDYPARAMSPEEFEHMCSRVNEKKRKKIYKRRIHFTSTEKSIDYVFCALDVDDKKKMPTWNGRRVKFYGHMLNHSLKHANVKPVVKHRVNEEGTRVAVVIFRSLRDIKAGEELLWDYSADAVCPQMLEKPWIQWCPCIQCEGKCWCDVCEGKELHLAVVY